jgi:hypothetical protein
MDKMCAASVSGSVRSHRFSAFHTLKDKRMSLFGRRGFFDRQSFFNSYDVAEKFTLGGDGHCCSPVMKLAIAAKMIFYNRTALLICAAATCNRRDNSKKNILKQPLSHH